MSKFEQKTIDFSSGESGKHHYCQWTPEHPAAWLHIMHGMSEHGIRYRGLAQFLNQHGIMVTAGDHRGHGQTGEAMASNYHIADSDGWNQMLDDQWQLINHIKTTHSLPLVIMGHSMGSFLATHFCQKYGQQLTDSLDHKLCGLILSGSNYAKSTTWKSAAYIAKFERWRLGPRNPSPLLEKISFGSFNNAFKPVRTPSDWLSRDDAMVDAYIADPHCGGPLSTQSWCDFLDGMTALADSSAMAKMDKKIPIYLFAGKDDPVGQQGKGVEILRDVLVTSGVQHVDMKLYPDSRHETLNETNRDEVYTDLLNWIAGLASKV